MALINEWILESNLKDSIGDKDLKTYGSGTLNQTDKATILDGTYGLSTNGAYSLPSNYTLSILLNMNELSVGSQWSIIFGNGWGQSGVGSTAQGIIQTKDGQLTIMTGAGDGYTTNIIKMEVNKLYHLVMTMSDTGYASFYIDGEKVYNGQLATATKSYPLTIGGFANSPTSSAGVAWSFLKAKVSNARLYDNVLNDDEVLELYYLYNYKNKTLILHDNTYKTIKEKTKEVSVDITPKLTGVSSQVIASGEYSANYASWKVFDSVDGYGWLYTGLGYIGYDFLSIKKLHSFSLKGRNQDSNDSTGLPTSFVLEYLSDNDWVVAQSFTATWATGRNSEVKLFTLDTAVDATASRVRWLSSASGDSSLGELRFYAYEDVIDTDRPPYIKSVSSTLPTVEQFLSDGMDSLSPLLDRRVETLEPLPMTDKSEILSGGEGKMFSKTIDLIKYLDIRNIKVEVK